MSEVTKILYVDDYPLDRALVRDALKSAEQNFLLQEAASREEFLELLDEGEFDLVLSDFNILGFTGLQVLEKVQTSYPDIPVIIVTGTGSEEIAVEAIKRGAADYVIKTPQYIRRLPRTIENALANQLLEKQRREALQQLRENETRYRELLENLQEGVWGFDHQAVTTFVNPAMAEMLGYQVGEMVGKSLLDFLPAKEHKRTQESLKKSALGLQDKFKTELIHKNRSRITVRVHTSPLMAEDGTYQGGISALQDITKLEADRKALAESKNQLQTLVENTPGNLWSLDSSYRFLSGNHRFLKNMQEWLGKELQTGDDLLQKLSLEEKQEWKANYDRALQGESFQIERQTHHSDQGKWSEYHFSPISSEDGPPDGVLVIENDITERKQAAIRLEENEQKYRSLVDQAGAALFLHDMEGRLVDVNQAAVNRYGYSRAELLQLTVQDIDPDFLEREDQENVWKQLYQESPQFFQARHQTKVGDIFSVEVSLSPVTIDGEDHIIALAQDITERKRQEERIQALSQRFQSIVEDQTDFICRFTPDERLTFVNQAYCEMRGGSRDELVGKTFIHFIPPEARDEVREKYTSLTPENPTITSRHPVTSRDGEIRWQEWTDRALFDSQGNVREYQSVGRDITEQVAAQEALRESERRLSTLMANLPGMAYRCRNNRDWDMLFVSQGAQELTGFSPDQLQESGEISYADLIHTEDQDMVWDQVQQALETQQSFEVTYRITTASGQERWVWERGIGTRQDQSGRTLELEGFITDITDRIQAREELESAFRTLTTVLESIDAHIYVSDLETNRILYMNQKMITDFGEDLTGEICHEVFRGEETPCPDCPKEKILDQQGNPSGVHTWEAKNAATGRWYLNTDRAIYWTDQQLVHIQIALDIHDRKTAEKELKENQKFLQAIYNQSLNAIMVADDHGNYLEVNQAAADLFGHSKDELESMNVKDLQTSSKPNADQRYQEYLKKGYEVGEFDFIHSSGEPRVALYHAVKIGENLHLSVLTDITQRKQAQLALEESNLNLRLAQNIARIGNWSLDPEVGVPVWSEEVYKIYERDPKLGPHPLEDYPSLYQGDHWKRFNGAIQAAVKHGEPYDIQLKLELDSGSIKWIRAICQPDPESGPAGHFLRGTIQDITEERLAARALEESEAKYRQLFVNMLDGFALHQIVLDKEDRPVDYIFLEVNTAFEKMTGLKEEEVIGKRATRVLQGIEDDPADWIGRYGKIALGGAPARLELYSKPVGKWFSILAYQPEPGQFATIFEDVTERKLSEKALTESERRYRNLVESSPDGIITLSKTGKVVTINQRFLKLTGYPEEDILNRHFLQMPTLLAQDLDFYKKIVPQILQGKVMDPIEFRWKHASGEIREGEARTSPLRVEGEVTGLLGIVRDITERKEAEQKIHESEQRYRQLYQTAGVGVGYYTPEGDVISMNEIALQHLQMGSEEVESKNVQEIFPEEAAEEYLERIQSAIQAETPLEFEDLIPLPGGEYWFLSVYSKVFDLEGKITGVQITSLDISQRKQYEENLRASKETAERYLNIAAEIILSLDHEGKIRLLNPSGHHLLGYQEGELIGKDWFNTCVPKQDQDQVTRIFKGIMAGEEDQHATVEGRVSTKTGQIKHILWHNSLLRDASGRITGTLSSGEDISQRIESEAKLREREAVLNRSQEIARVGSYIWDLRDDSLAWSENMFTIHGLDQDKFTGNLTQVSRQLIHPQDQKYVQNTIQNMVENKKVQEMTFRIIRPDGEQRVMRSGGEFEFNESGEPIRAIGVHQDITEEIKAQQEILESRELLVRLSRAAYSVQNILDPEEIIDTVGQEISALGYNPTILELDESQTRLQVRYNSFSSQLVNKMIKLLGIQPEDFSFEIKPGGYFDSVLQSGTAVLKPVESQPFKEIFPGLPRPLIKQVQKLFDYEATILAPLMDQDQPVGLLTVLGSDITEEDLTPMGLFANQASTALATARYASALRQRSEELVHLTAELDQTEEEERARLARELHDQVGQSLALLGFNLNMIKKQLKEAEVEDLNTLYDAQTLLEEISGGIRSVMDDLRPSILDDYGLLAALHWLADKFSDRTGIQTEVSGTAPEPRLDPLIENTLFRISQEAFTNAARHAEADQVKVQLKSNRSGVKLILEDDGVGFDTQKEIEDQDNRGWGLINMQERAARIGGKLTLESSVGKGTKITISVPRE